MPHPIEEKGIKLLKEDLDKKGRSWKESDIKTFDLIVDGKYSPLSVACQNMCREG